ncbi:Endoglucanase-4 [Colletotrichum orbiculare MAFF 240422]|uniref:lytic cellulose monooxygenase (C4-dehydrogenating) n=2 Tax=Colletotrichum orbiculare species complex TaxID=2707354 RepID=N4UNY0_COLOR|nr:Endoglucanase-4 [Colletotrichum orbiculare MAFF 240422]TDZ27335.1 Endoglucanase-4 [Colletotrichum spinosum]
MSYKLSALTALAGAAAVMAHGHVKAFQVNGGAYEPGFDVFTDYYKNPKPERYGWYAENTDNGFVAPDAFTSADIACHKNSKNAALTFKVAAGDKISFNWDTWPDSHKGPVIDYLAPCGDDCATVDKASLSFFKIAEKGYDGGKWASDEISSATNFTYTTTIPSDVKPGKYVWRHEIIALHSAGQENGAQNYPQCLNFEITGSGTKQPEGTLATKLYTPTDAGILVSIYSSLTSYTIPGPANSFSGASSGGDTAPAPASSAAPAASSAPAAAPASSAPAATSAAAAATTTAAAEAVATPTSAPAAAATPTSGATKPSCEEKRRRRLARRMARQHARDVVRAN